MRKKLIFFGSLLLGLLIMIVIYFSIDNIIVPFRAAPWSLLLSYVFVVLLIHSLQTIRWKVILNTTGHKLGFGKLFTYRIMGYSLNYITPSAHIGGEPLKAAMLKENNVPYADGVSSLFINKIIEVFADGFFAFTGLMIILISFALPKEKVINLVILSILCVLILFWLFFNLVKRENAWHSTFKFFRLDKIKYLKGFEAGIKKTGNNIHDFFISHKGAFRVSVALSLVMWGLMFLEYKILFLILGFDASFIQLFVIISFVGLAYIVPIPAALGVLEAGQLSAFSILGLSTPLGIAASIVIRAKDLIITLFGLLLISIKGLGAIKTIKETEDLEK